ncbi:hypothetical protein F7725_015612 [Dissostichus mawsoni]|uniref:SHSP domain-containing protein n=1 Tax=Dissostichus mawsoni TaxID=36200 RepID=A0A7J5YI36_DISMA|nr:hypothetical protein F7725_015612 [Dissostichus mawsoni]
MRKSRMIMDLFQGASPGNTSTLPQGVDLQHITSSLSGNGVLSIEAPAPGTSVSNPANEIVIPVQIKHTQDGEK